MTISLMLPLVGKTQTDLKRVDKGSGSMSFTRATTATRLNPDTNMIEAVASGDLREDGRKYYNLLRQSNEFGTSSWVTDAILSMDGSLGPDGKACYALKAPSTYKSVWQVVDAPTSMTRTVSWWVKRKSGSGAVWLGSDGGSTYSVIPVDGTWRRFSSTTSGGTVVAPQITLTTSGDEVYISHAQLEEGSSVGRYVNSGSYPAYAPKGVLIEGQRTNLAAQSGRLDLWSNHNTPVITYPGSSSPISGEYLTRIEDNNVSDTEGKLQVISIPATVATYVLSFYVKAGTLNNVLIFLATTSTYAASFNLTTGQTTVFGGYTPANMGSELGPNSTWRVWISGVNASGTSAICYVFPGTGVTSEQGTIEAGAAQFEAGSFPSSYIPTAAVAVTRNADVLTAPTSGNVIGTVGSVAATIDRYADHSTNQGVLSLGPIANNGVFAVLSSSREIVLWDGTGLASGPVISGFLSHRIGIRWANSEQRVFADGVGGTSAGFDGNQNAETNMQIGCQQGAADQFLYGHVKNLHIWNRALSDAELQAITAAA